VQLRLFGNRAVLVANFTGLVAGIGMYMLMSMMIRFVQTPTSVPYGFGATVVIAGLVLLPMSAGSFAASKVVGSLAQRLRPSTLIPIGTVVFAAALPFFVLDRADLWVTFVQMGIAGFGVGCLFAVLPRMIVRAVPPEETSSALALHQVLRTVGYAVGSALSAATLAAHTAQGDVYPANTGYSIASIVAIGLMLIAGIAGFVVRTDRPVARPVQIDNPVSNASATTSDN
jgi:predicted MFS family arabinose efflux permease